MALAATVGPHHLTSWHCARSWGCNALVTRPAARTRTNHAYLGYRASSRTNTSRMCSTSSRPASSRTRVKRGASFGMPWRRQRTALLRTESAALEARVRIASMVNNCEMRMRPSTERTSHMRPSSVVANRRSESLVSTSGPPRRANSLPAVQRSRGRPATNRRINSSSVSILV